MTIQQPNDKKQQILAELGEELDRRELISAMNLLDQYTVNPPAAQSTDDLIALLKPVLQEQAMAQEAVKEPYTRYCRLPTVLQLVQPQAMLLSKWFVIISALVLLAGLAITNAVDGNTLKFLANASPVLGILTVLYEFRAKFSGVNELEASCPYSSAQLATARLIVVLGYNILLCLAVTPLVSYWQDRVLWQVIVSWLAPLLLMLGIALTASLRFGIAGGCLVSATAWALHLQIGKGSPVFSLLLPVQPIDWADFISLLIGTILVLYSYKRWCSAPVLIGDDQSD